MHLLWDKPAILLNDALLVGDLHIGLEQELFYHGIRLASTTKRMKEKIIEMLKETGAEKLFLMGDLKHRIASVSAQEAREIPEFLKELSKHAEITVILGNHDGGLKPYLKEVNFYDARGFVYTDQCLIHGSAKPLPNDLKKSKGIIASHWHPVYTFRDRLGAQTEKVWVQAHALGKPLLLMPSFNPLLGGVDVRKITNKWIELNNAEITLLDGVSLGKLSLNS
ncbi:metallophosphoesterase [archaeon]|nr:metallophosphoesterase [archaeon]